MFRCLKWLRALVVIIVYPVAIALFSLMGISGLILWMSGGITLLPRLLQHGFELRLLNALFTDPKFHLDRLYEQFAAVFLFIIEYVMRFMAYLINTSL
ncbi:MAG: hypothetical protein GFH27_549297n293 [Chloroflexi bacterium AL-W]|nr:hypothetical protein [Chloroflexi bacterium AL-N1]NOK68854.1 hypothetical protein [Chloroflexi bacterium AL-N10]NOK76838.1 hypothetical protein [Chloroflexi bacterium AL-N5]NOK82775.1 hypothetical protein [Chloroflexi bacterium AL-W]NOK90695.1 hypothetical protein [Chloroflexi bacterium AL-N15]